MTDSARLKARWVFPIAAPPIDGGLVETVGEEIAAVRRARPNEPVEDLGDVAILPQWVNAHTHLELRPAARLGRPGIGLAEWIELLLAQRQPATVAAAVAAGAQELAQWQTAAAADIRSPLAMTAATDAAVQLMTFAELLGPTDDRAAAARAAVGPIAAAAMADSAAGIGLSPHAPYTVTPELLRWAAGTSLPLAMHLAESEEELEWLAAGTGPLADLLARRAAGNGPPRLPRLVDYLSILAAAPRALVVHGNYLDAASIAFVAARRATMSVVYCPRTHAWFGHRGYPLAALLAAGVRVALGTDSRASTPDLNLAAEVAAAAAAHGDVAPAALVGAATLGGAAALGLDGTLGTLQAGKRAALARVPLSPDRSADPYEWLIASL